MQNIKQIAKDPEFLALPDEQKLKVFSSVDADFAVLPVQEQQKVLSALSKAPSFKNILMGTYDKAGINPGGDMLDVGRAIKNVPNSALNQAKNITEMVLHPVRTAKSIKDVVSGVLAKGFMPGEQESEKYADALGEAIKNEYGSLEKLQEKVETDPVGFGMDFASLISGAGGVTKLAGKTVELAGAAQAGAKIVQTGESILQKAKLVDPTIVITKPAAKLAGIVTNQLPERVYSGAAKLSNVTPEENIALVREALKREIMPTVSGRKKLSGQIADKGAEIEKVLQTKPGAKIDVDKVLDSVEYAKDSFKNLPESDVPLRKIDKVIDKFKNKHGGTITASEAQAIKRQIYKIYDNYYTDNIVKNAGAAANKSIAHGLMTELNNLFPDLKKLNADDATMIQLNKSLQEPASRLNKRAMRVLGLTEVAGGAAGYYILGFAPALAIGFGTRILSNPKVQAKLSIALYKARKIKDFEVGTPAKMTAVQASRLNNIDNEENNGTR